MSVRVVHDECVAAMTAMATDGVMVDSVVTDPPYHLTSIVKRFGADNAAPAMVGATGAYARASKGFMGKQWDGGDVAFRPETWAAVMAVMKPGAHLIAFSGSRTYHRMACAIEDAGFEIRDMISWNYGSGFPKSHNIVKKLQDSGRACQCRKTIVSRHHVSEQNLCDLQRGMDAADAVSGDEESDVRAVLHEGADRASQCPAGREGGSVDTLCDVRRDGASPCQSCGSDGGDLLQRVVSLADVRGSATPDGEQYEGPQSSAAVRREEPGLEGRRDAQAAKGQLHRSPIRARASLGDADGASGRLHHGASASDGADVRLPADPDGGREPQGPQPGEQSTGELGTVSDERGSQAWGGWPVCAGCFKPVVPEGYGTALKPAFEPCVVARKPFKGAIADNFLAHGVGGLNIDGCRIGTTKSVPASAAKDRIGQLAKGDERGRTADTDGCDPNIGRWPANVLHDGSDEVVTAFPTTNSGMFLPHHKAAGVSQMGTFDIRDRSGEDHPTYGDSGSAARFFYSSKADADDRCGSKHPTVKPTDLMAYLCRLVTPAGGTVLDPFAGSGSTGMACLREGFDAILIEREAEYVADIQRRIAHVSGLDSPLFGGGAACAA